ncbi:MAG: hypothetical protein ACRCSQ_03980 [Bacteroidales bacterium]
MGKGSHWQLEMKDKETRICTGMTLAFYGLLLLLNAFGIFSSFSLKFRMELLDWRTFLLYGAAFFLIFKKDKTIGLLLLVAGLLTRFNSVYGYIMEYLFLVVPLAFLFGGSWLLVLALKK